jgi:glycosyltransferase involved in cell wall biosynthesis
MDTLLPNFLVAKLRRKVLVYDSHEYWTELPELIGRPITRKIWLLLENWMVPRVNAAYTVNQSLAEIYTQKYGVNFKAIRNLPIRRTGHGQEGKVGKTLIYQGALNIGRGIELMIEAVRYLPGYRLLIAGTGDIEAPLRKLTAAREFARQIEFCGFVDPEALSKLTATAALGLSLEEDRGLSYHFALPNKLFDYIQAGVPALVSDLPEMGALVTGFDLGEILPQHARNPETLAATIRSILEDDQKYQRLVQSCRLAANELCWENEQLLVRELFGGL